MKYCPTCNAKYEDSVSFCATDGEVLEDDATHIVDSTLDGQDHIESLLGKGGMGEVYRAKDTRLDRVVAIKVLPGHVSSDPELKARFEREAKTLASLNHPNIAAIYGFEKSTGLHALVMELVEGDVRDFAAVRTAADDAGDDTSVWAGVPGEEWRGGRYPTRACGILPEAGGRDRAAAGQYGTGEMA